VVDTEPTASFSHIKFFTIVFLIDLTTCISRLASWVSHLQQVAIDWTGDPVAYKQIVCGGETDGRRVRHFSIVAPPAGASVCRGQSGGRRAVGDEQITTVQRRTVQKPIGGVDPLDCRNTRESHSSRFAGQLAPVAATRGTASSTAEFILDKHKIVLNNR
jgi:hypothetical protein